WQPEAGKSPAFLWAGRNTAAYYRDGMLAALGLAHKGHNNYRDLGVSCAVVADRHHGHTLEQPFMLCSYKKQIGVLGRVYEPITRIALDDPPVDFRSLVCCDLLKHRIKGLILERAGGFGIFVIALLYQLGNSSCGIQRAGLPNGYCPKHSTTPGRSLNSQLKCYIRWLRTVYPDRNDPCAHAIQPLRAVLPIDNQK